MRKGVHFILIFKNNYRANDETTMMPMMQLTYETFENSTFFN